jgi:hypothetical protein
VISGPAPGAGDLPAHGGLPLAPQITASLLKADPTLSAAGLAAELAAGQGRLERLAYDDGSGESAPSVAVAFEASYRRLDAYGRWRARRRHSRPGAPIRWFIRLQ